VFAFTHEIDAWLTTREQAPLARAEDAAVAPSSARLRGWRPGNRAATLVAAAAACLGAAGWVWLRSAAPFPRSAEARVIAPRPVANDAAAEGYPSFAPDGERLVFRWERANAEGLYIKSIAGGAALPLPLSEPSRFTRAAYAKWSPDGRLIAFLVAHDGEKPDTFALYVVPPSGGTPRHLTTISGTGLCWAPDGATLAFSDRSATGEPFSIFVMSLASGTRRRVTEPPPGSFGDTRCSFSHDGSRLAISRFATRYQSDVFVVRVAGGADGAERLTYDVSGIHGIEWTPDGRSIAFGTHQGLWTVPAEKASAPVKPTLVIPGAVRDLTFSRTRGGPPRLVYHDSNTDVNVWRWDATAPAARNVTRVAASTTYDDHPALSPDGRRMAFASNRTGANEIWVAGADGSGARQLTFYNGPLVIAPRWSPDGQRIAFAAQAAGNWDIHVIEADGSRPTRLTWEPSQEDNPSWSRDGRWLYLRSDRDGVARIWKVPAEGGAAVRVTTGPGSQAFEAPDGKSVYFVRSTDVPGAWKVPVGGGPEVFVVPNVGESFWGMAETGIAFLVGDPRLSPAGPTIRFFDFATGRITVMTQLVKPTGSLANGFAVAGDARAVVWCQADGRPGDLMLIDPWP
jgi:Tol biopolymer transport system component